MKIPFPSFTRIDTFSNCPRQYAEDVIAGPTPSTPAMERGSHLHNCLEVAAKKWLELDCPSPGQAWAKALDLISSAPPEGVLSQQEIESYLRRASDVVGPLIPVKGGVEAWFDDVGVAHGLPLLPIRGKIDLISETGLLTSEMARAFDVVDGPAVIDYKTISGEHKIKTSWEARRSMQLKIYCLATGLKRAGFVYFPPKSECRAMFVEFSDEDLQTAHRWLTKTLDAMLECWRRFFRCYVQWGETINSENRNWEAWPLAHPDWYLCSPKWCGHYDNCIGAKSAER
jgi:hypothetical protein